MYSDVVIIGSGHAGGMSAISLRKKKFRGSLTIVGEEPYLPYQRPPLSKNFLANEIDKERIFLKKKDFYAKNNISLLLNTKVKQIVKEKNELLLSDQKVLKYRFLIIATGASLIKLKNQTQNNGIKYLRNIDDAEEIKSLMKQSKTVAIVGSGYIGLEIAATAIKSKLDVTVIEKEKNVMTRVVSKEVSEFLSFKHKEHGVKFIFENITLNITQENNCQNILLDDNHYLKKDLVIAGIGVLANTKLAEESGIKCNNGIIVDENCMTSEENIFAIGDCANKYSKLYKKHIRLESVQNAIDQGKVVANYLTGGDFKINEATPWFWSDQYDIKLQIAGISEAYDKKIIKGSILDGKFTVFYVRENHFICLEAVNSPKDFMLGKKFIENKTSADSKEANGLLES
tara:strand:- start:3988 stop:5187 length:1200 start_codon:yes stop_codon:yes gene_type:complete